MCVCVFASFCCRSSVSLMSVFVLIIECIFLSLYCYTEYVHTFDVQSFDFYCSKFVVLLLLLLMYWGGEFWFLGWFRVFFLFVHYARIVFKVGPLLFLYSIWIKQQQKLLMFGGNIYYFFIALSHEKANFSILFSHLNALKKVLKS